MGLEDVLDAEGDEEDARIGQPLHPVRIPSAHSEPRLILIRFAEERHGRHGFLLVPAHLCLSLPISPFSFVFFFECARSTDQPGEFIQLTRWREADRRGGREDKKVKKRRRKWDKRRHTTGKVDEVSTTE